MARKVKMGENQTLSTLAIKEGISESTIETMNKDKNLSTLTEGDVIRLPDKGETLPDIEEQEQFSKDAEVGLPKSRKSGYVTPEKKNGVHQDIEARNPANFTSPKEIENKKKTPKRNFLSKRSYNSLYGSLGKDTSHFKSEQNSVSRALTQMEINENLGLQDEDNFDIYQKSLQLAEIADSTQSGFRQGIANIPGNLIDRVNDTALTLIFGEDAPVVNSTSELVDKYLEYDRQDFKNRELPDKEERIELAKKSMDKSENFDNYTDAQKNRLAQRVAVETEKEIDALQEKTGGVLGDFSEDFGSALTKLGIELGIFGGLTRAIPASTAIGRFGRAAVASPSSGLVSGFLAKSSDTPEQAINNALTDAGINFGIDVAVPGMFSTAAKSFKSLGEHSDKALSLMNRLRGFDEGDKVDEAIDAYKTAKKAAEDGDDQLVEKATKEFKSKLDEASLKANTKVVDRVRQDFNEIFEPEGFSDDVQEAAEQTKLFDDVDVSTDDPVDEIEFAQFLDYQFGEKMPKNLTDQQLIQLDTWFKNLKNNDEAAKKAKSMWKELKDFRRKGLSMPDKEKKMTRVSEWFNAENMLKGEDGSFGNQFMEKLINGANKAVDKGENATRSDVDRNWLQDAWDSIMKQVGPMHVKMNEIAETSGRPMDMAYMDYIIKNRQAKTEFRRGLGDNIGSVGIDDLFARTGMWGDANNELEEKAAKFLRNNEYKVSEIDDEMLEQSELITTEGQKRVVKEFRNFFEGMKDFVDIDPDRFIKGYMYRRYVKDKSAKANAKDFIKYGNIEEIIPGFKHERKWGDVSADKLEEIVDNFTDEGVEVDRDLQSLMKDYLHAVTQERHVNGSIENFKNVVKGLEKDGHVDAEFAREFIETDSKNLKRGRTGPVDYLEGFVDTIDTISGGRSVTGQKIRDYFERTDIPGMITGLTYGAHIMGDQMFRVMNGSQNILTKARIGEENFQRAFFDPANNQRLINMFGEKAAPEKLLDDIIDKSNVRNSSDQFITWMKTNFAGNVAGKEANKNFFQKLAHNTVGFGNMTGSDRFNVRNAYFAGSDTIDNYADDYIEGSMDWDEFVKETKLHRSDDIVQDRVKEFLDEGRVGQMVNKETGERLRISDYLSKGEEFLKNNDFEFDPKSAEAVYAFDTTWNTQWNYGSRAMGKFFWRENKKLGGKLAQSLTLPFQTWWINMATQLKDMIIDNPANADQVVNMMTTGHAYADAVEQVFNEDGESFFGFSTIPSDIVNSPPAQAAMAAWNILNKSASSLQKEEGMDRFDKFATKKAYETLSRTLYSENSFQKRSVDLFSESLRAMSGGSMTKSDLREIMKDATGADLQALDQDERVRKIREAFDNQF